MIKTQSILRTYVYKYLLKYFRHLLYSIWCVRLESVSIVATQRSKIKQLTIETNVRKGIYGASMNTAHSAID